MTGRKKSREIYDNRRGDGWILVSHDVVRDHDIPAHSGFAFDVTLYYTDDPRIETTRTRNINRLLRQLLDVGARLGPYPGEKPEKNVPFDRQSEAVRNQRLCTEIYDAVGHARGMSPTIAVRAAQEFGETWRAMSASEWKDRVKSVGEGRSERIVAAL